MNAALKPGTYSVERALDEWIAERDQDKLHNTKARHMRKFLLAWCQRNGIEYLTQIEKQALRTWRSTGMEWKYRSGDACSLKTIGLCLPVFSHGLWRATYCQQIPAPGKSGNLSRVMLCPFLITKWIVWKLLSTPSAADATKRTSGLPCRFPNRWPPTSEPWGAREPVEDLRKNECGSASQGRNTNQANDRVEDASTMPAARERLPCMEMSQELSFAGPHAPCACGAARFSGDRCFLRAHVDNTERRGRIQ